MPEEGRTTTPATSERVVDFIHLLRFDALPTDVVRRAQACLVDLVGVAAAGTATPMSSIARTLAATELCGASRSARILFDGRRASCAGAAFAGATTIDAFDAHDGHPLTKGHAGVAILPALLALVDAGANDGETAPHEFIASLVLGYEIATRGGIALHASVPDFHCSGAWNAIGCAAVASRTLRLDRRRTREALGVAEYLGPRGPIMRVCATPSMVKDGSGWGAHVGVIAALLAREGFTGAPAVTIEAADQETVWSDLGMRWRIREQYVKAYPVCRWAQPAVEAALALQRAHRFAAHDIAQVHVETFREAAALGASITSPTTTEDAQYSLMYPVAAALAFGGLGAAEIDPAAFADDRVTRLLPAMSVSVDSEFAARFPAERWARVEIDLNDGRRFRSEPARARGDADTPFSDSELSDKFFSLSTPVLGRGRAERIERLISGLAESVSLAPLVETLLSPVV